MVCLQGSSQAALSGIYLTFPDKGMKPRSGKPLPGGASASEGRSPADRPHINPKGSVLTAWVRQSWPLGSQMAWGGGALSVCGSVHRMQPCPSLQGTPGNPILLSPNSNPRLSFRSARTKMAPCGEFTGPRAKAQVLAQLCLLPDVQP